MRVAMVGLGAAGRDLHLPALKAIEFAEAVGGCDVDPAARDRVAQRWGLPVFSDVDEMLDRVGAEVVIVATPPATHADYCLRAIRRGAHVICEKPFASSVAEADLVIAAAAKAGRQVAVNHEFREMPIFRALVDGVKDRASGALRFVQAWQTMDLPPWQEAGWRGAITERTLFEAGVHQIDLLLALFGEKPFAVQALTSAGGHVKESDAVVAATLVFPGNRLAQLTQTRLCKGAPQYFEVRADTDTASFRASFGGRARVSAGLFRSTRPHVRLEYGASGIAWREQGTQRVALARNPRDPNVFGTRQVLLDALTAFRDARTPRANAPAARDVLEVIAACYVSARTGGRVDIGGARAQAVTALHMGGVPGEHV